MSKTSISPDSLFNSKQYGFSQIVVAQGSRTVYWSGQVAWDEHEQIVGAGDLRAQVWRTPADSHLDWGAVFGTAGVFD